MTAACAGEFGRRPALSLARNMNCPNGEGLSPRLRCFGRDAAGVVALCLHLV